MDSAKNRVVLYANPGMILTDGNQVYGSVIHLAESKDKSLFYNIAKEEYEMIKRQSAEGDMAVFYGELTDWGKRSDYSYGFANWAQSVIDLGSTIIANKVIYMFMCCKNLIDASNINIVVKNSNPSMQGFCMGNLLMIQPPNVVFETENGASVAATRTWISAYANCAKMQSCCIYLGDGTQDPIAIRNSMQNTFVNCMGLENLIFEGKGSPIYLDLSSCTKLSYESLQSLYEALMDVSSATSGNYDIKISKNTFDLLSSDDMLSFEQKGWNIIAVEETTEE